MTSSQQHDMQQMKHRLDTLDALIGELAVRAANLTSEDKVDCCEELVALRRTQLRALREFERFCRARPDSRRAARKQALTALEDLQHAYERLQAIILG